MVNPQLLKYLESYLTPERRLLFEKVVNNRTNFLTLAIEDVYQLHNTSAVMRSCDVFGIQNLHVIEEQNKKKIDREIAMGAQKWVSLNRYHTSSECIEQLKEKGYQIIATAPHEKNSTDLESFVISKPSAIFLGTERKGLSREVLEKADHVLKIPMYGFTESLNISVSAAIILNSLNNKLRNSKIKWELSSNEKNEVKFEWLKKSFKDIDSLIDKFLDN